MKGVYTEIITDNNHLNMLKSVLRAIKPILTEQIHIEQFHDNGEGVDRRYNVYKIIGDKQTYILKKSDDYEIGVYEQFLADKNLPVPKLEGWTFAGIMPYSLDIARLIAHGSDKFFPFPFYMTEEYRKIFLKDLHDKLLYKPKYKQFIWDVLLSCLNECIEFIERELNDKSIERDEVFTYYYKNALSLSDTILNGMDKLDIL